MGLGLFRRNREIRFEHSLASARRTADTNLEFAEGEELRCYWSTVCACVSKHVSNDVANAGDQQGLSWRAPRTHEPLTE